MKGSKNLKTNPVAYLILNGTPPLNGKPSLMSLSEMDLALDDSLDGIIGRQYDENGTIDTYYSDMFGSKYQYSNLLNQNVSYSVGADYAYNWGKFNNNGSYTASTKGNNDNLGLFTNAGIKIFIGHSERNLKNSTIIVRSSAIKDKNIEIKHAKKKRIPIYSRAEVLADVVSLKKKGLSPAYCTLSIFSLALFESFCGESEGRRAPLRRRRSKGATPFDELSSLHPQVSGAEKRSAKGFMVILSMHD